MLELYDLRCEYRENPLGVDTKSPRFSWKLRSDKQDVMQTAYTLQAALDPGFTELIWDTGRREGDASIQIAYGGKPLSPLTGYHLRVKAWDNQGEESGWIRGTFETGLLGSPWQASFITCALPKRPPDYLPPWVMRRSFTVKKPVARARALATALGLYELRINGAPADDSRLNPGWTSYHAWMQYQVYDVTNALHTGENTVEALVGEGWYNGEMTFAHKRNLYGDQNALLLELHLDYADGTREVILSDGQFQAAVGPILLSTFYDGEIYDARREDESGWEWTPVSVYPHKTDNLTASVGRPVRPIQELAPVAILHTPKGETLLDMGQNMVGFLRFSVKGQAGQKVVLKHAEVLDKDGNFYSHNIRLARQEIHYTLRGGETEVFSPHFTFQGFRYVKIIEYPGEIKKENFTGVVVHTDLPVTGEFSCSNPLVNQLQHNIRWGQKGNFVDLPTDCPQRDERLGWTADAQVFMPTACFNMDCALFFTKWLRDLRADQIQNGAVPFVIPDVLPRDWSFLEEWGADSASATWGDAATIGPWVLYQVYGDTRILEESYDSMVKWVGYIERESGESCIWSTGPQLGDWVALDAFEGSYLGATPTDFIATAYFAMSADLVAKTARVLGREEDARRYAALHERIKAAFRQKFLPEGRILFDTQTSYILPLMFNLVDGKERKNAVEGLAEHLRRNHKHLTTGFVGTPYLCHALSENGEAELAYDLLFQEDFPSWLYQIKMGATTVWEHWDGVKPDGSMWSPEMNSFNHYAYGSIGDWLYRAAAGINPEEPGFKRILLRPKITRRLEWVECAHESPYGRILCRWEHTPEGVRVTAEIPPNTTVRLVLPEGMAPATPGGLEFGSGRHEVLCRG